MKFTSSQCPYSHFLSPQIGSWKWVNPEVADFSEAITPTQPLYVLRFKDCSTNPVAPNIPFIKISHILWTWWEETRAVGCASERQPEEQWRLNTEKVFEKQTELSLPPGGRGKMKCSQLSANGSCLKSWATRRRFKRGLKSNGEGKK